MISSIREILTFFGHAGLGFDFPNSRHLSVVDAAEAHSGKEIKCELL